MSYAVPITLGDITGSTSICMYCIGKPYSYWPLKGNFLLFM